MKQFSRRPGVELLEISGEYLLVATKDARESCPYVTQINEAAAEYWRMLDQPCSIEELTLHAIQDKGKEKKDVFPAVLAFIGKLSKNGYLVEEEAG